MVEKRQSRALDCLFLYRPVLENSGGDSHHPVFVECCWLIFGSVKIILNLLIGWEFRIFLDRGSDFV